MPSCIQWAQQRTQECAQYKDEGYNACSQWQANCCTWWPCSWACQLVSWLCVAWYWVANVVCVAWTWVTTAFCVLWDVVTTVLGAIIETVESIVGWVLSAIAFVVELILSIPYLGRFLSWIWELVLTVVWGIGIWGAGLIDGVLGVIGIRPEKKLRICTIILRDEKGNPVANVSDVVAGLQFAVDIYRDQANVRIIPSGPFNYTSGFSGEEKVDESWVHTLSGSAPTYALDLSCGSSALGGDLGLTGTYFNWLASTMCFYGDWRRLLGYGAPVTVFVVRSFNDDSSGCSIAMLADYVTVQNPMDTPHELGHACNLWHVSEPHNLMNPDILDADGTKLDWWQVIILRDSRHVVYF